jgi:tetrahydromethanopterin S-methyltransferase subunit B
MSRIVLHRDVPDLLESIDPSDNLLKDVPNNDSLSTLANKFPSSIDRYLL